MKCKYEGTGVWAGRCMGTKEVDPCPGHDKCKNYKPDYMTNADRIRAMTDEELAKWLYEFFWGRKGDVRLCVLGDWLQQPYGGADHE